MPENVDDLKSETAITPPLRKVQPQQPINQYDAQISELDQAVSSITSISEEKKLDIPKTLTNNVTTTNNNMVDIKVEQTECSMLQNATAEDIQQQQQLNTDEAQMVHNTSDDSAMLNHVLDVMLDSKLINEILNAENELNFDENVLNEGSSASNAPQQNSNQQQQQAVYLEQPLTKRMRYDDSANLTHLHQQQQQQISETPQELTGDYAVFPQQSHQQQQEQQQTQYAQYDGTTMTGTLSLDGGQYQTPIDAMQLQQLLYQQQQQTLDPSAYGAVVNSLNITTVPQQQQQQLYDPNSAIADTKQILELCGGQQTTNLIKSGDFVTLPEDVSHQFQIFNVPSLTDDMEPQHHQQQQVTHHIVERQYVMPGHEEVEEQLIYEITTNNPVSTMSQQHQQQVLAEFLNQAASTYEQQHHQQLQQVSHHQQQQQHQTHFVGESVNKLDSFYDELLEFDYSLVETVKSLSTTSNSGSSSNAIVKSERDNSLNLSSTSSSSTFKYHEDFYFNVFFYAGIPRPLAINCFGLIKLPQGVATTFRKHLLTTRKANNSLMSLGGNTINGMVGQSSSSSAGGAVGTRFSNSKQLPSYFTNLANNGGSSSMANEFSIGSITITNASSSNIQQQQGCNNGSLQQQQNKQGGGPATNPLEINLNSTNGGISATSPVSTISRGRTKSGGSANNASGTFTNLSSNNLKHKSLTSLTNTLNTARVSVGTIGPHNAKTIFVSSSAALNSDRNKFIKRSLIAKVHLDTARSTPQQSHNQPQFTSKKLSDLLNGKKSAVANNDLQSSLEMTVEMAAERQAKLNRVNRFYEKRRKLLNMTQQQQNNRHTPYQMPHLIKRQQLPQPQQQQQQQQKLLKQQLLRSFSDCGINSTTNVATGDANVMRVFV